MMAVSYNKASSVILPNSIQYIELGLDFIKWNSSKLNFDEKRINDIELAAEETLSNVIQNAFEPGEETEFKVICEPTLSGLKIIVKDQGIPFDPNQIPVYNPGKQNFGPAQRGLSWYLVHQYMDEVSFHNLGRAGKEVHLVKFSPSTPNHPQAEEIAQTAPRQVDSPPGFPKNSVPFKARKATPKDAIEITKCAYDTYGYSYAYENIYYPDRLGALIESGEIISVIAETKDEAPVLMAHNALVINDPREKIAEMGMTFTKREYQKQGCGRKTGLFLVKEAIKKGLRGIWGSATMAHVGSQKGILNAGVKECAILIGTFQSFIKWKGLEQETEERNSNIIGYFKVPLTSLLSFKRPTVYLPEQHAAMLKTTYANLNENPRFVPPKPDDLIIPNQPPRFSIKDKKAEDKVVIEIETYGEGIVENVQAIVNRFVVQKVEVIHLYLNLKDPLTAVLTKEFEAMGFFYSGIFPRPISGDQLILQYLNNILIDYSKLQVYSDFAKSLLSYIQERDPLQKRVKQV